MRHNVAQCGTICGKMQHTSLHRKSMWHITRKRAAASGRQEIFLKYSGVWKWRISGAENKRFDFHRNRHDSKTGGGAQISTASLYRER